MQCASLTSARPSLHHPKPASSPRKATPLIVYLATKADFLDAVFKRDIESIILEAFKARVGSSTSRREVRSWKESLFAMAKVLNDPSIPDSCGVGVEYGIPQSSKRIDLLLSGRDETGRGNLMIVELKQWESARRTDMDGLVRTRFAEGEANTSHPSYQSWSYAELLRGFNETVDQEQVPLQPCAYLHNCEEGGDLLHPFYAHYVKLAPVFLGGDEERIKLRSFSPPTCQWLSPKFQPSQSAQVPNEASELLSVVFCNALASN